MKRTKFILSFLFSLLVSGFAAPAFAVALSITPMVTFIALAVLNFLPIGMTGLTLAGVLREVWTRQVEKQLSTLEEGSFLDGIEDFSRYVSAVGDENQVIHLVYMGVQPDVLINNVTYPIPVQDLPEEDIVITLDKYQTKATPITDDELYALSYEKISVVKNSHSTSISENKIQKAIHAIAPSTGANADMPVLVTTGDDDGTGRKRLVKADIIKLKDAFDKLMIPAAGRRLVLCNDHVNDLLMLDQVFERQYYNYTTGAIANLFGFQVYEYVGNPYYVVATKVKLAFGAVPQAGDQKASIAFSLARIAKAIGWTKMYFSEAKADPLNQRNLVNFRHHAIYMPKREDSRGAIISANV